MIQENQKDLAMTQEEKDLVLQDLCARLPYGVKVEVKNYRCNGEVRNVEIETLNVEHLTCPIERYRPYLRPMSSMTEEERKSLPFPWVNNFGVISSYSGCEGFIEITHDDFSRIIDWLNAHHFDWRGLIPKGLAISTEVFNPYNV